jgi:hypothetical protein
VQHSRSAAPNLCGCQAQVNHSTRDDVDPVLFAVYWICVDVVSGVATWGEAFEIA